jgi:hypothetical protein
VRVPVKSGDLISLRRKPAEPAWPTTINRGVAGILMSAVKGLSTKNEAQKRELSAQK